MKKHLLLSIAVIGGATQVARADFEDTIAGKTHYTVEPVYDSVSPEHLTGFRERMLARQDGFGGAFQAVVFGGRTRKEADLGVWFYPCPNKCELVVSEGPLFDAAGVAVATGGGASFITQTQDVLANHFDIRTVDGTFESTIRFRPTQSFVGGAFSWRQELWTRANETQGLWFEAVLPVVHVKNRLGFSETVINDGGGANPDPAIIQGTVVQPNMSSAFTRAALCNGQTLDCCTSSCPSSCSPSCSPSCSSICRDGNTRDCCFSSCESSCNSCPSSCSSLVCNSTCTPDCETTALANAELLLWYDYVREERCRFGQCLGVVFPTSDDPDSPRTIWSPIAGSRHWGIEWGHSAAFEMFAGDEWAISAAFDYRTYYLFKRKECRIFDLCGKPWSRYMRFHQSAAAAAAQDTTVAPFVNGTFSPSAGSCFTTFAVDVHPRTRTEFNAGFAFDWRKFQGEIGYHLTARQSERIKFCCSDDAFSFGIAGGDVGFITANTQSNANIKMWDFCEISDDVDWTAIATTGDITTCADLDGTFRPITCGDIDLTTGAHTSTISHKVYGALSYRFDDMEYPLFINVGGAYTFSADNSSVTRWSVWGKIGLSI